MFYFKEEIIENWLKEDVPYFDLTTFTLGIEKIRGKISYTARQDGILCGSEEVKRLFEKVNVETTFMLSSGTKVKKGDVVYEGKGNGEGLHMGWKVGLNIFEYSSGIATRTNNLVNIAKKGNPDIEIITTRKVFPGTKELSIKAVINGGATPHRLGISETILVFQNHINLLGNFETLCSNLKEYKNKNIEKRFLVEVENENDAYALCEAGVDALQFDKFSVELLKKVVAKIKLEHPDVILIATGGVNENNVFEYAQTGVHGIATTSVYFGNPFDMGAKITQI